mmetsp:Transcript_20507/g.38142  ORF Transcript_20507/g.38142 Transcript_20507/m.38142 type:complete len:89 (-) Transcript_20507:1565-1831(-)
MHNGEQASRGGGSVEVEAVESGGERRRRRLQSYAGRAERAERARAVREEARRGRSEAIEPPVQRRTTHTGRAEAQPGNFAARTGEHGR